MLKVDK